MDADSDSNDNDDNESLSSAFSDDEPQIVTPPRKKRKISPTKARRGTSTPQEIASTLQSIGATPGVTQWDDSDDDEDESISSELSEVFEDDHAPQHAMFNDVISINSSTTSANGGHNQSQVGSVRVNGIGGKSRKVRGIKKKGDEMSLREIILDDTIVGEEMPSVIKRREELRKRRQEDRENANADNHKLRYYQLSLSLHSESKTSQISMQ